MKTGVIAGNFDVIHPGYIAMFKECKENCDRLVVLLHGDPTIERLEKLKPILSVRDRREMLLSLEYVDDVVSYDIESELYAFLKGIDPDVRFLGDDYIGKKFTGDDLAIPVHYINRDHGWSTTKFKKQIADEVFNRNNI
jgi:glycerol-3-phosphate cytidylyltransferase